MAHIADQERAGTDELYSVIATGGEPVKLSGPMAAGGSVDDLVVAYNGQKIVYQADQEVDEQLELYVAFDGRMLFLPVMKSE